MNRTKLWCKQVQGKNQWWYGTPNVAETGPFDTRKEARAHKRTDSAETITKEKRTGTGG
jgi:hypothetical protein